MARKTMRACKTCGSVVLTKDEVCPICRKSDSMSPNFSGLVIILTNPEESEIAKKMNITQKGLYAIRVR